MQPARVVFLDDEQPSARRPAPSERLGSPVRIALFPVRVELGRALLDHNR